MRRHSRSPAAAPIFPELTTARLLLRRWRETDLVPFAAMNADPEVMSHLGGPVGRTASDVLVGRFLQKWDEEPRFGFWAVELATERRFIGFVGLNRPDFSVPPAPCVEIGWRIARADWGRGYATEAAAACLAHGLETLILPEIVSFTVPDNTRSRRVMERIGMTHDRGGAFDHPLVPAESPHRRHVLYRITQADWQRRAAS